MTNKLMHTYPLGTAMFSISWELSPVFSNGSPHKVCRAPSHTQTTNTQTLHSRHQLKTQNIDNIKLQSTLSTSGSPQTH